MFRRIFGFGLFILLLLALFGGLSSRSRAAYYEGYTAGLQAQASEATEEGSETAVLPQNTQIQGDPGRLDQVLSNLVVNALRHTPENGRITFSAKLVDDGVQIQVTDSGEGIPEADLPFVFERFWRGNRARTHSGGAGGGLGLAIVKQMVVAHDGRITVTSTPHQATTFTLTFSVA